MTILDGKQPETNKHAILTKRDFTRIKANVLLSEKNLLITIKKILLLISKKKENMKTHITTVPNNQLQA